MPEKDPHTPLPASYKNAFPFTLATTSFIYPDHYAPNVRMLGPFVDEIELLFFDSVHPGSPPSKTDIDELARLAQECKVTYNVHLPNDVSLTASDPRDRETAVANIQKVLELTKPLHPSSAVLHLPMEDPAKKEEEEEDLESWLTRGREGIAEIRDSVANARTIAVETLDYPLERAMSIITEFDLSICMDIGHLLVFGYDPIAFFERHADRIAILHLHGVQNGKDHLALNHLNERQSGMVVDILNQFTGVVSLEVFSYKNLAPSLEYLANRLQRYGGNQ